MHEQIHCICVSVALKFYKWGAIRKKKCLRLRNGRRWNHEGKLGKPFHPLKSFGLSQRKRPFSRWPVLWQDSLPVSPSFGGQEAEEIYWEPLRCLRHPCRGAGRVKSRLPRARSHSCPGNETFQKHLRGIRKKRSRRKQRRRRWGRGRNRRCRSGRDLEEFAFLWGSRPPLSWFSVIEHIWLIKKTACTRTERWEVNACHRWSPLLEFKPILFDAWQNPALGSFREQRKASSLPCLGHLLSRWVLTCS